MAQSAIAICNVALTSYLGADEINSFDEPNPEARQCKLHYDRVRLSLLEQWDWLFAQRRELLVALVDNDRPAWGFKYAMPGHVAMVRWVNNSGAAKWYMQMGRAPDTPREMSATAIYSDVPDATVCYTRDETDPTLFTAGFADVLSAYLAAAIAMPITRDATKMKGSLDQGRMLLNQAQVDDFNARPSTEQTFYPETLQVRGYGAGWYGGPYAYPFGGY